MASRWRLGAALRRGPGNCVVCGDWSSGGVCPSCLGRFAPPSVRCPGCALPWSYGHRAGRCAGCLRDPPPWRSARCAVDYVFPWDGLVQAFKFAGRQELAGLLADAMEREVRRAEAAQDIEWILPVPLSDARLSQRGYDQAWELARVLGKALHIRCAPRALRRPVDTIAQSTLDRPARTINLRGAFAVDPAWRDTLARRRIALVDDVMTTGASFRAATNALIDAGAQSVDVWCVARTP